MARQDDYANAFKIAADELRLKNLDEISRAGAVEIEQATRSLKLDFINRPVAVSFPEVTLGYLDGEGAPPITEQVMILHYLNQADGTPLKHERITYREIPSGEFYFPAFIKRAEAPMLSVFGPDPRLLIQTAPLIGGRPLTGLADAAVEFRPLPRIPISLLVWGGDDEFEPSGKILFDRSISHYLSTEDVAWLSGMIVYRLMRLSATIKK